MFEVRKVVFDQYPDVLEAGGLYDFLKLELGPLPDEVELSGVPDDFDGCYHGSAEDAAQE